MAVSLHCHEDCWLAATPSTHSDFWTHEFEGTVRHDDRYRKQLISMIKSSDVTSRDECWNEMADVCDMIFLPV